MQDVSPSCHTLLATSVSNPSCTSHVAVNFVMVSDGALSMCYDDSILKVRVQPSGENDSSLLFDYTAWRAVLFRMSFVTTRLHTDDCSSAPVGYENETVTSCKHTVTFRGYGRKTKTELSDTLWNDLMFWGADIAMALKSCVM
jgi:hypothetical protein